MKAKDPLQIQADERHFRALRRYRNYYSNAAYEAAIGYFPKEVGKATKRQIARANRLVAAAIALCGSPYMTFNPKARWTREERAFLLLFASRF